LNAPVGARLDTRRFPQLMRLPGAKHITQRAMSSRLLRPILKKKFFDPTVPDTFLDQFFEEYRHCSVFADMFDIITPTWFQNLIPVDVPAVIWWGENERVLGADQADAFLKVLPLARVVLEPGWDHFPMVERPSEYATRLGKLVDELTVLPPTWQQHDNAMTTTCIVHLGSGNVARAGVGNKASLVDRCRVAGLAVPIGFVILDDSPTSKVDSGSNQHAERKAAARTLAEPLAVRSAFSAEDSSGTALAGMFSSVLHVTHDGLESAVRWVRASGDAFASAHTDLGTPFRRDVLVMEQVAAQHAGVAFTEPGWLSDIVNETAGLADRLVSGDVEGDRIELSRFAKSQGWEGRLAALLRDVRRVLSDRPWDIEWADDGTTCWLVQVRPITVALRRNEVLTVANHKEILPALPSVFMTSIIERGAPQLFGWYRQFDRRLPSNRSFIHVVAGRPFINLSLLEDMVTLWGLPSRLIADSFGGEPSIDQPLDVGRFIRSSPNLLRLGLAQITAVRDARRGRAEIRKLADDPGETFSDLIDAATKAYSLMVIGMLPLSTALTPPVALLRRFGTLDVHGASHATVSTQMASALAAIHDDNDERKFLAEFGHRGIYESDLARPRFGDGGPLPRSPLDAVSQSRPKRHLSLRRRMKVAVSWPIWAVTRPLLDARETHRHETMRAFHSIRRALRQRATEITRTGVLRQPDDVWMLRCDEVATLDQPGGLRPDAAFWSIRAQEIDRNATLSPPDLVRRFDDPAIWSDEPVTDSVLFGIPLTSGVVHGRAWVLDEPSAHLPPELLDAADSQPIVLVARSVDAGWAMTFPLVAAVVVDTGGDLSHGSIVLRELGKPAITNLRSATRLVVTGSLVCVDADQGNILIVE
jgi:rifampicin phosphotransferase